MDAIPLHKIMQKTHLGSATTRVGTWTKVQWSNDMLIRTRLGKEDCEETSYERCITRLQITAHESGKQPMRSTDRR